MSRNSNRDEVFSSGLSSTPSSLLRIAGGWGNIGGPSMLGKEPPISSMIRSLTSGTITSIFTGMVGALFSVFFYDTASVSFMVCSCLGFIVGTYGFYRDSLRKSLLHLDRYPRLLQLHLDANFPSERFDLWPRSSLRSDKFKHWRLRSMLIVGWLSAVPAIETMIDNAESEIIEQQGQRSKSVVEQEAEAEAETEIGGGRGESKII